uniref:C2 domain-containing protein n=1 Tax=Pipistrellus kuhlii TaxID=59472 RepID=A0A7J7Y9E1_PIPKU|nr:hypothetical protein mPipKuh1_010322 [Pipistrellus kuhlii]
MEDKKEEAQQPLLKSEVGVRLVEEEWGIPAQRPEPMDGSGPYLCLPLRHRWENHTWRLHSSNCVQKVAERLVSEAGAHGGIRETAVFEKSFGADQRLQEVESLQRRPGSGACTRHKQALEELVAGSRQFCHSAERRTMTRPNALDRCRGKLLVHSLNLFAKQGLRLLRGLRRGNVQEKVTLSKKLLAKLCFLAQEPQPPLPDVLVWMLSGRRHVACARIPAQDVLFSVVEEERGQDCGKIQSLLLTVRPAALLRRAASEPAPGDFSYFQLRAHLHQARGVLAADGSGLSDPFARVLVSTQCQATRVLEQTLSPLWDELLVFDQLIVDGRREHLHQEPPLAIVNVFDHNKFGPPVFLGRAPAAPRVKLLEDPYQRPELQFFPLRKGPRAAGELIATFELIELDYSGRLEPSVPSDVEPQDLAPLAEPLSGRLSLPPSVLPVSPHPWGSLCQAQAPESATSGPEALFWGLRGLGHVHLFEVEQPQVVLEPAGRCVESEVLASYHGNPNFTELVRHLTVDLPERPYLQPPLSILVIERRAFGRMVLVGSHIVPHMMRFTLRGHEDPPEEGGDEETGVLEPKEHEGQTSLDPLLVEAGIPRRLPKDPRKKLPLNGLLNQGPELEEDIPDPEELDWWSKYYASLQELRGQMEAGEGPRQGMEGEEGGVNVTSVDGEAQDQGEADVKDSMSRKTAIATLKIYSRSLEEEFNHFEDCSEGQGPELTVAVFDHDLVGSDDLIGETHNDLENRFYSHHGANCGLASQYDVDGYNAWRDAFRPSQILAGLCQRCGLPAPEYRAGAVKVGSKVFPTPPETLPPGRREPNVASEVPEEAQALFVLWCWQEMPGFGIQLVPEHVETRPLYHPRSPGLLQGSLHMWIDIFPHNVPAPPPVDIKPRQPISYELRVIIWNTEDVVLGDVNPLTGEMSSDIYVKRRALQLSDRGGQLHLALRVPFDYLPTEPAGPFALEEAEFPPPAPLVLQAWDYDRISANDFLGPLELQLPDMVRGARGPELCSARLARRGVGPRCSLFRCRRVWGWWPVVKLREPEDEQREQREAQAGRKRRWRRRWKGRPEDLEFADSGGNVYILTGKVEAEFELLTVEAAEKRPVGMGREEPEPLEKPKGAGAARLLEPDHLTPCPAPRQPAKTSFNWFVNPLKTFVFFIWRRYWRILVLLALILLFLLLVFYSMPGQISQVIFQPLHHPPGPN